MLLSNIIKQSLMPLVLLANFGFEQTLNSAPISFVGFRGNSRSSVRRQRADFKRDSHSLVSTARKRVAPFNCGIDVQAPEGRKWWLGGWIAVWRADYRIITLPPPRHCAWRYARCTLTDGFMSSLNKSVGNFERRKSASYVIHLPEQAEPADRWSQPRLHGAGRRDKGYMYEIFKH